MTSPNKAATLSRYPHRRRSNQPLHVPPKPVLIATLFLAANALVPLIWGDVYPFTTAPMFRDTPQHYCRYRVSGPEGELPVSDFLLQRIYDGNPPGYGVGIEPPPTLNVFGEVQSEAQVRAHVAQILRRRGGPEWVEVEQEVIGAVDAQRVGVVEKHLWRIAATDR